MVVAQSLSSLVIKHFQRKLTGIEKAHLDHLRRTESPYHAEAQKRDQVTQLSLVFCVSKKFTHFLDSVLRTCPSAVALFKVEVGSTCLKGNRGQRLCWRVCTISCLHAGKGLVIRERQLILGSISSVTYLTTGCNSAKRQSVGIYGTQELSGWSFELRWTGPQAA